MKLKRCRLTEKQQGRLLEFFVGEMTARTAADLAGINKTTAAYFWELPSSARDYRLAAGPGLAPGRRDRGRRELLRRQAKGQTRSCSAAGKVPVFGILKRGGRVYTKMIPDASSATLIPIINRMIRPDSIVYTDTGTWASYNALDISDFHHLRINHSKLFADRDNHINGIENFSEPGETAFTKIQRRSQTPLPSVPQRVRMAFQRRIAQAALETTQKMGQTGKQEIEI